MVHTRHSPILFEPKRQSQGKLLAAHDSGDIPLGGALGNGHLASVLTIFSFLILADSTDRFVRHASISW